CSSDLSSHLHQFGFFLSAFRALRVAQYNHLTGQHLCAKIRIQPVKAIWFCRGIAVQSAQQFCFAHGCLNDMEARLYLGLWLTISWSCSHIWHSHTVCYLPTRP